MCAIIDTPSQFAEGEYPALRGRKISDKASGSVQLKATGQLSGQQPGDPVRAAKAIITAIDSDRPPLHLVLGAPSLQMARAQLDSLATEFDAWEKVTFSADYNQHTRRLT